MVIYVATVWMNGVDGEIYLNLKKHLNGVQFITKARRGRVEVAQSLICLLFPHMPCNIVLSLFDDPVTMSECKSLYRHDYACP